MTSKPHMMKPLLALQPHLIPQTPSFTSFLLHKLSLLLSMSLPFLTWLLSQFQCRSSDRPPLTPCNNNKVPLFIPHLDLLSPWVSFFSKQLTLKQ